MAGYRAPSTPLVKPIKSSWSGPTEETKAQSELLEAKFGFSRVNEGADRLGWLMNMQPSDLQEPDSGSSVSAVDYYFIQEDGSTFKVTLANNPYFYVFVAPDHLAEVESHLKIKYQRYIFQVSKEWKEDLDMRNHLSGLKSAFLKIRFHTISDLLHVRSELLPHIKKNLKDKKVNQTYSFWTSNSVVDEEEEDRFISSSSSYTSPLEFIEELREHDVPYYIRTSIDFNIRVGFWYTVSFQSGIAKLTQRKDLLHRAELRVLAFDIETTKLPLKFPDADIDSVMMISYMIDGQGYLIINRECVSEDIEDFEYTPKPEFEGPFTIFNELTEVDLLNRFFEHIRELKPNVYVTFNGDYFDWPFVDARAKKYGIYMTQEIGVFKNRDDEYRSRFAAHLDAYKWVVRDSYLPVGSQGLKAVTKAKLGYDPVEVDPEDMVRFALEKPQAMASYSVSDAVATYYLYMKYVHPFIFSLCTIIPMNPDDVLRKGSGTLCETLLMVEAANKSIIFPNKQRSDTDKRYQGHLLESETYVGGHVEALRSGIFRNDIPEKFQLDPQVFQELIDQLDKTLRYTIEIEGDKKMEDVENFEEIRDEILGKLLHLQQNPSLTECPNIYHLDVGAMYPNIILTNRLQPSAIVSEEDCAACDYNSPENDCQRPMQWTWRGDYIPASNAEHQMVLGQLEAERFKPENDNFSKVNSNANDGMLPYSQLPASQKHQLLVSRLKNYSSKVYGKTHQIKSEERVGVVCQRENPFYVDTVRAFRDRRYKYKADLKQWRGKLDKSIREGNMEGIQEGRSMNVLFDSLQLAHKCILNSFYGYVMRRGARWFSMEMAGIVTYTGAQIIKKAREVLDGVGIPLELDTDGIWTLLPNSFPENFEFRVRSSSKGIVFSYPCVVLNYRVRDQFINTQYQTLNSEGKYEKQNECSIFFEVDGPYRAMILPASTEEGKRLKKRYAVFNNDAEGSLAELKGFEIKRRGELKLVKYFQSQVFKTFLKGSTREECYSEVAKVANNWLDVLYTKGSNMIDEELIALISCSSNMSKKLEDYGARKSTAITTAKRLAQFLGNQIVKDKGLACRFIIASKPSRAPVAERAIPTAIFSADISIRNLYLQKWLGMSIQPSFNIRDIIDWDYYIARFAGTIQKIITIPAAMQKVSNPVPRLPHPDWLKKKIAQNSGTQLTIQFAKKPDEITDIENLVGSVPGAYVVSTPSRPVPRVSKMIRPSSVLPDEDMGDVDTPMPDSKTNYAEWLVWSKKRWRKQNARKRVQRPLSMSPNAPSAKRKMASTGLLAKQQTALYEKEWEIVQIQELENSPGDFRLWALIDDKMYPIQLSIPHLFYIHSRTKNPGNIEQLPNAVVALVEKKLPHSKASNFVYKLELSERQYRKHVKEIAAFANLSDVDGIYETQVPSMFRALTQLGCFCKFADPTISIWDRRQSQRNHMSFQLHQLERVRSHSPAYLSQTSNYKISYLYTSSTESRAVFCLIFPHTKEIHLFFVSALPKCSTPNIEALYEKYMVDYSVHMKLFKAKAAAIQQLNELIRDNKRKYPGPSILLLQDASTDNPHQNINAMLQDKSWSSLREFPVIPLHSSLKDSQYPPFAWEGYCIKLIATRYEGALLWFTKQGDFCEFVGIPVGNVTRDYPVLSADLSFARKLLAQDFVLWISPTTFPDLGTPGFSHSNLIDEIQYPERCKADCFTSVTVSLELRNLALNTILQSHHVNDIEQLQTPHHQQNSFQTKDAALSNDLLVDESFLCFPAFQVLKQLVTEWSSGAHTEKSKPYADVLLDHIYRWISAPTSMLYDPALLHFIHSLMKKVFLQLLAECKALGATIVQASFTHLVINTPKYSTKDAKNYMEFMLRALKKKKLFSWLDIEPMNYWETVLFLDRANYSAVEVVDTGDTVVVGSWDMAHYLSDSLRDPFLDVLNDYTRRLHGLFFSMDEIAPVVLPVGNAENSEVSVVPVPVDPIAVKDQKKQIHARKEIIRKHVTPRLFTLVHDVQHNMSTVQESGSAVSPALHFIQYICKGLSLDTTILQEIVKLQKNLFKLAQVREFSKEAEFENPSKTYILHGVMCEFCSSVSNIDLLRDPRLVEGDWTCEHCKHEFDKIGIEKRLIDILKRKSLAYQLQDIVCEKCHLVKEDNTALYCKNCSGTYLPCLTQKEVEQFAKQFQHIADVHHFSWLQEISTWQLHVVSKSSP